MWLLAVSAFAAEPVGSLERAPLDLGGGWTGTVDPRGGGVRTAWGRGIPVDDATDEALARSVVALLAAPPFSLRGEAVVASVRRAPRLDTAYVEVDLPREGVLPWRGGLSVRVKHGRVIAYRSGASPRLPVAGTFDVDAAAAERIALALVAGTASAAEPTLLERGDALRRAWIVRVAVEEPVERWVVLVDGETGAVLHAYDEVARAIVEAEHHERTAVGPLVVSPLPYVPVAAGGEVAFTDASGVYDLAAAGPYTFELDGSYVTVVDDGGDDAVLVADGPDLSWVPDAASRSEVDVYVALHAVKAWGERAAPDVDWVWEPIRAEVRQRVSWCNAYFLGWGLHFYQDGLNCWDPAQNADVAFHEWGHGLHFHGRLGGTFDLSLSEGAGDVVAFLQTGDARIAPDFFKSGAEMRDVSELRRWPDDYGDEPHENGRIFAGAMWDLRGLLQRHEGEEAGQLATEAIFTGLLKGGPDVEGSYVEALVADDDDGDLANGTPRFCEIATAFGRHGLGPLADGWDLAVGDAAPEPIADEPVELVFPLDAVRPECLRLEDGESAVRWRVDGGAWQELAATGLGAAVSATVPGQPAGAVVDYALSGRLEDGTPFAGAASSYVVEAAPPATAPGTAPTAPVAEDEGEPAAAGGCGCASAGASGAWALVPLLAALRRRGAIRTGGSPS